MNDAIAGLVALSFIALVGYSVINKVSWWNERVKECRAKCLPYDCSGFTDKICICDKLKIVK
jgi:hypothetical protein